ncbi:RimJ/RimL family protein N-acetyltransferase [Sphingomonas jejuensis]|uniref:RimJ/RimL family protein N-acetyltransferase n=1 Tax=Sphingomonas jejuensis TaxID=904715 RepID=A0ABX0XKA8_9SPHN|nr:RimJ/RimL family protein N-acetyltransferase [Sphingomonas jejuensis]
MIPPTLETARLRLRAVRLDDFDPLYAGLCDPAVNRYLGGTPAREEFWGKLLRIPGQWALDGFGVFVVADRATDVAIGQTGLARFRRDMTPGFGDEPEHSWIIGQGAGRGLATEAATAALAWMERTHAPERTVCLAHPDNAASLRVAAKLGYRAFDRTLYKGAPAMLLERTGAAR